MTLFMRDWGGDPGTAPAGRLTPLKFPDTESYLWQLRSNFIRMTDRDCVCEARPGGAGTGTVGNWRKIGALEVLENG